MIGLMTGKDTQEIKSSSTENRIEIPRVTTMMIKADEQTATVTTTRSHKATTNKLEDTAQKITHQSNETIHKKFMITMKHRHHKRTY
jgi:NACalpha-BTF3-like transcription factor